MKCDTTCNISDTACSGEPEQWIAGAGPHGEPFLTVEETPTSLIVLVGGLAFKAKKPVHLPFLDLGNPQARLANCRKELSLNRRMTPDVYLGLSELRPLEPPGTLGEPLVVMRRLPHDRRLSTLVTRGDETRRFLTDVAGQVARLHAASPVGGAGSPPAMISLWDEARDQLAAFGNEVVDPEVVDEVIDLAREYLAGREALLVERERSGHVCDGHGDLRADHIFCLPNGARVLDCLEYDDRLRVCDTLCDVASLAMDLEMLGPTDLADGFLDDYRRISGDRFPRSLVDHYIAYRAFVGVQVECLQREQGNASATTRAAMRLDLCRLHAEDARVHLVLIGGPSESGRSMLAEATASSADLWGPQRREWARLRLDPVREDLVDESPCVAGEAADAGRRSNEAHLAAAYAEVLHRAAGALAGGTSVIIDAPWASCRHRQAAQDLARIHSAALTQVRCDGLGKEGVGRLDRQGRPCETGIGESMVGTMIAPAEPWPEAIGIDLSGGIYQAAKTIHHHLVKIRVHACAEHDPGTPPTPSSSRPACAGHAHGRDQHR
jgi:aminoglycoside phosphotransferase family enzyme/predicted kinase